MDICSSVFVCVYASLCLGKLYLGVCPYMGFLEDTLGIASQALPTYYFDACSFPGQELSTLIRPAF